MRYILWGTVVYVLIINAISRPSPSTKPPYQIVEASIKPTKVDTVQIDTSEKVLPEDQLLNNVGLDFDFLANRINRKMRWDDNGNLFVYSENKDPDTIFLSKQWTLNGKPKMVLSYKKPLEEQETDVFVEHKAPKGYIEKYAHLAQKLMREGRVPASITLAQAIHESGWGKGGPAQYNNHFGIKCQGNEHDHWKNGKRLGETLNHCMNFCDDDCNDMFRIYRSVEESFIAHDKLLHREWDESVGNYGPIWSISRDENITRKFLKRKGAIYNGVVLRHGHTYTFPYYVWMCIELKNEGYATDKNYASKLVRTIIKYKLYEYDKNPA